MIRMKLKKKIIKNKKIDWKNNNKNHILKRNK
jgi:hypothetical protein